MASGGSTPLFTDSSYVALGVARNRQLEANRDSSHYDLGLCANGRTGLADRDGYRGRFKPPTWATYRSEAAQEIPPTDISRGSRYRGLPTDLERRLAAANAKHAQVAPRKCTLE
jgi:hypothetical protein